MHRAICAPNTVGAKRNAHLISPAFQSPFYAQHFDDDVGETPSLGVYLAQKIALNNLSDNDVFSSRFSEIRADGKNKFHAIIIFYFAFNV